MNPDRLFDYLDGRLPENERHALEEELMNDAEARREFDVARRIHLATRGTRDNLEVLDESALDASRGRRAARQVLLATLVLVATPIVVVFDAPKLAVPVGTLPVDQLPPLLKLFELGLPSQVASCA